jgi:SAM-dependent methyltransferase
MSRRQAAEAPRSPLPRAALCQALAALTALALTKLGLEAGWPQLAWVIGLAAALLGWLLRLPPWWLPLQLVFAPALYWAQQLALAPGWYLAAFALCLLLLGNSLRDRVPLYLSSRSVWNALAQLLPPGGRWLDLGCGSGGGLLALSRQRPQAEHVGVESAPLLWLLAKLRFVRRPRCRVLFADLWALDLSQFDLVYAFLSPAPMPALWRKARQEMRPGSLLVSNSFMVPQVPPTRVIEVDDRRRSRLYVWQM